MKTTVCSPSQKRSMVYSILKCEFGFPGYYPEGFDGDIDKMIEAAPTLTPQQIADHIAIELDHYGMKWAKRIDSRKNVRAVIGGKVVAQ